MILSENRFPRFRIMLDYSGCSRAAATARPK
jgi:hypothetical protein